MKHDRFLCARSLAHLLIGEEKTNVLLKQLYRRELRNVQSDDPIRVPLASGFTRRYFRPDGDGFTEYRIIKGLWTPHEIHELVDESWISIRSPYDCSGQIFTEDIHARQTPVGLVWIHRMGVDV